MLPLERERERKNKRTSGKHDLMLSEPRKEERGFSLVIQVLR